MITERRLEIPRAGLENGGGSTSFVASEEDTVRIKQTLYRTDDTAKARILSEYPERLTDDDLTQYREQGYVALEGLLTPEEVEVAKAALSDIIWQRTPWNGKLYVQEEPYYAQGGELTVDDPELRVRKLFYFCKIEPRLKAIATHPRLTALLDQLVGPGSRMIADQALIKPPFHGSEKPWHQDNAYFDWAPLEDVIGVWIALDEATVENGCMQVIPGSHRNGPTGHFHLRDCQIPDQRVSVPEAVVVPLRPGGVLLFSSLLHHGTPPNRSATRRRALQFHYAAAHCHRMDFKEHAQYFLEGGAYAGCRKWDPESGISKAVLEP